MFLSDISYLHKLTSPKTIGGNENPSTKGGIGSTIDQYEMELDRLYTASPLITEWNTTYTLGDIYLADSHDGFNRINDKERFSPVKFFKDARDNEPISFSPRELKPIQRNIDEEESPLQSSGLTRLIELNEKSSKNGNTKGKIKLTIYLPDTSDMEVYAATDCTISDLIRIILKQHEQEDLDPPLEYRNPLLYELRMHEGDGEPDRDFPAYNKDQILRNIESDEFCLCLVENASKIRTYSLSESLFTTPPQLTTSEKSKSSTASSYRVRERAQSGASVNLFSDDYSSDTASRPPPILENAVLIKFPDGKVLRLEPDEDATLLDLIPMIAQHYRIRLFTDEFEFLVSPQDQKALMLTSPVMDIQAKIYSIGTRTFEIQKKVYADSSRINRPPSRSSRYGGPPPGYPLGNLFNQPPSQKDDEITFTEATANAYQQWNVVKKNKFGIKQERVFGIDGKKVYNAKRGQLRGGMTGVHRAEREIASIVKIEKLSQDAKTFRITWMDNGDIYYIEYTCETSRECSEIVAKIRYLLTRHNNQSRK